MDFKDVIALWGTRATLADEIGVNEKAVHQWALRNYIPPEKFPEIIEAARGRALRGDPNPEFGAISYELLHALGRKERGRRGEPPKPQRRAAQRDAARAKKRKPSKRARAEFEPCV